MTARVSRYTEKAGDGGYTFDCPGCGNTHMIPVGSGIGPRWGFNGSVERPTFTPSLLVRWTRAEPPVTADNLDDWKRKPWPQAKVAHVCHSFITEGRIQFLGDCTHALAGQTVDLPTYEED